MLPTRLNGVFNLGLFVNHVFFDGLDVANRLESQGKDVTRMRQILNRGITHPEEVCNFLPLKDLPQADFDGMREYWHDSVLNPPAHLESAEARPAYEKITVPCCYVSGWYDFFTKGTFNNFNSMREKGASRQAREGQHLLMGPWLHTGPTYFGEIGDIHFGTYASTLESPLFEHNVTFFNKYLKGMDIDLPAIRYFVMGKNIWQTADSWPLPQTQWQRFFLHSKGRANTSSGDGLLSRQEPGSEPADVFYYDPLLPVPSTGCRGHGTLGFGSSPKDQSYIEKRDDILCYTTLELGEDIEVTGPLKLHLAAATSAKDTDFTAKQTIYHESRYPSYIDLPIIKAVA
jgi:putative CocE/NonD family hydrolase